MDELFATPAYSHVLVAVEAIAISLRKIESSNGVCRVDDIGYGEKVDSLAES